MGYQLENYLEKDELEQFHITISEISSQLDRLRVKDKITESQSSKLDEVFWLIEDILNN